MYNLAISDIFISISRDGVYISEIIPPGRREMMVGERMKGKKKGGKRKTGEGK